ncbi:MAG: tetratricopeptide repeat protein [Candidatus Omnitrophota bacterium]
MNTKKFKHLKLVLLFIFVIFGFIIYVNSLFVGFLWDDFGTIVDNPLIKQIKFLPQLITSGLLVPHESAKNFYRPVQSISNMLDFFIYKDNPAGFHFTNIFLHILCAILFFNLFVELFGNEKVAFVSCLFFLIHPVNVETVTYISGRADSLALLFLLISFNNYVNFYQTDKRFFLYLTLVFFGLALFSKEVALSGFFIFPLLDYLLDKRRDIKFYLLFVVPIFIYLALRFYFLGRPFLVSNFSLFERTITFFGHIFEYLRIIFFPINLHMSYTVTVLTHFNLNLFLKILVVFLMFYLFYLRLKSDRKIFIFSFCWFFVFLLPQSNIFPINAFFADHFIYLSQYGLFFILTFIALEKIKGKGRVLSIATIFAYVFVLSLTTFRYSQNWIDPEKFYRRIITLSPGSFAAYNNLGAEMEKRGKREEARRLCLLALGQNPDDALAVNNLGRSYLDEGEINKSIALFKQAIEKDPNQAPFYYNLGRAYRKAGNLSLSSQEYELAFKKAKELAPWDSSIYLELALLFRMAGKREEAIQELQKAISIDPKDALLHLNLGLLYKEQGFYSQAIDEYLTALRLEPDLPAIYNNLGTANAATGNLKSALYCLLKALELDDNYQEARFNLGLIYLEIGNYQLAKLEFSKIPKDVSFYTLAQRELKKIKEKYK